MRLLLRIVLLTLACMAMGRSVTEAQELRPAVAFEKAARDTIFIQRADSLKAIAYKGGPAQLNARRLFLLGASPDGKTFVVAGTVTYLNPANSLLTTFTGIFSVPSDLNVENIAALSRIKLLQAAPYGEQGFHPTGAVNSDGSEWFALFQSASAGGGAPLQFYHGRVDGTGTVDSVLIPTANGMTGGYHFTNIALTPDQSTMVTISVDQLSNESQPDKRYQLYRWNVKAFGGPQFNIISSIGDQVRGLHVTYNTDSSFGAVIRVLDDQYAEFALANTVAQDNSLQFFKIRYTGSSVSLNQPTGSIARSVIPSDENFFAGKNGAGYNETVSEAAQPANGGDMMYSRSGDSLVFITHEAPDNINNRGAKSGVYIYDGNSAKLIYNDPAAQELSPVFIMAPYYAPPKPHYQKLSLAFTNFGTVDTGKTATNNLTITNAGDTAVTITNAMISGSFASEFSFATNPVGMMIDVGQSTTIPVVFTPQAPAGQHSAQIAISYRDTTVNQMIRGTSNIPPIIGVHEDPSLRMNVQVMPNPFTSSVSIRLTAVEAGAIGIVVHDALGRVVYAPEHRNVGIGANETFEFNAKSLGLATGTYYVTALFGEKQISQQVVFVR